MNQLFSTEPALANARHWDGMFDASDEAFPFIDAFSQFAVAFPRSRPMGPGPLHPRAMLSTYHLFDSLLWLWTQEGETWAPIKRSQIRSLPWVVEEEAWLATAQGEVRVTSRSVFVSSKVFACEFCFEAETDVELPIHFSGKLNPDEVRYLGGYFMGSKNGPRSPHSSADGCDVVAGWKANADTSLSPCQIQIRSLDGLQARISPGPLWAEGVKTSASPASHQLSGENPYFSFSLPTLGLKANEPHRVQFEIGFCPAEAAFPKLDAAAVDFDQLVATARSRFEEAAKLASPPQSGRAQMDRHLLRARAALLRDGLDGTDGEFGERLACLCSPDFSDFSCSFFWDTIFSSVAISDFHPEYAKGALRTAFTRHIPELGSTPERHFNWGPKERMPQQSPQSPVGAWALTELLKKNDDEAFLKEMYPILDRNHRFWVERSDGDGDGLSEYTWSGQICDNSPLWDGLVGELGEKSGCGWVPPVASVALNCFLYKDARHMKALSERLGLEENAAYYESRMTHLKERLDEICFDPEDQRYWDFFHATGRHTKVKTFYLFWPLFAELPMEEKTRESLLETLLDPEQFFGSVPFPSVAYDEPAYEPNGYWRGKAWPHICYWLLQTLCRHGREKEAHQAADRLLAINASTRGFLENVTTDVLQADPTSLPTSASKPDYNWGCAAFYLMGIRAYAK